MTIMIITRSVGIGGPRVRTTHKQTCHRQQPKETGIGMLGRGHRVEKSFPAVRLQQAPPLPWLQRWDPDAANHVQ